MILYFFIFVNYIAFYFEKCYYFGGGFMDKKKNIIILVVTSITFILLLILFIVSINKGKETINELKLNNDANIKSASKATTNNGVSNKSNGKDEDETITRQDNNDSSVDIKNENDVIQYFESNYNDINSNKVSIKDKAKEYFIDIVDFIGFRYLFLDSLFSFRFCVSILPESAVRQSRNTPARSRIRCNAFPCG